MSEKTFKIKKFFFKLYNFLMGYYIILYNILLLFGGLFISGGLSPPPKWLIASANPTCIRSNIHKKLISLVSAYSF